MKCVAENRCFDGRQLRYQHWSETLQCDMHFSIFIPPQAQHQPVPVVYWLSGLTCTDQNFVTKAGAQRVAAALGVAIVCPDTSPRGDQVATGPEGNWAIGLGAGFYVDATESPWAAHYQMHSYIRYELPELIESRFAVTSQRSILGHSMGGHGALTLGLRYPEFYASTSAFAPICEPSKTSWGRAVFSHYLGDDIETWQQYDACALMRGLEQPMPIKVDQGANDEFMQEQLHPEALLAAAEAQGIELEYRLLARYDHSYYFIATFIEEHLLFHMTHLRAR